MTNYRSTEVSEALWRDGDRIASRWHGGFSDRVTDDQLQAYADDEELHEEDRAFAAAVLALRRFERASGRRAPLQALPATVGG